MKDCSVVVAAAVEKADGNIAVRYLALYGIFDGVALVELMVDVRIEELLEVVV